MLRDAGIITEGNLYDIFNVSVVHHVQQSLRAQTLFTRDVDYIVRQDKIVIIDEFTGRMMEGRRYSDGLHQALEAKEHVTVQPENQTLASITFQNYFRLFPKLAGMTGTAMTEADEFAEIYKLDVVEIPTNVAVGRLDEDDEVYRSADEKYEAVAGLIADARTRGQPVLVGTTSIEKSEQISAHLKKKKIPHAVLNARFHEQEATIVAQAGAPGAVTIATNMAGRGTDIKLGGNLEMRLKVELEGINDPAVYAAQGSHDPRGDRRGTRTCARIRRPVRDRHRAAREPAHRQSAARPLRPAGRSWALALLPVARRRSDAHLRFRPDGQPARPPRPEGRRGDRASLDQPGSGEGAEKGRGAQLRHPQERAEIRRRDECPAQGSLRPAQGVHEGAGRVGDHRRNARGGDPADGRAPHPGEGVRRAMAVDGTRRGLRAAAEPLAADPRMGRRGRHRRDRDPRAHRTRRRQHARIPTAVDKVRGYVLGRTRLGCVHNKKMFTRFRGESDCAARFFRVFTCDF